MEFHFAYLDPGSGSIIWQAIVGGVLGGIYLLRGMASRIIVAGMSLVKGGGRPSRSEDSDTDRQ